MSLEGLVFGSLYLGAGVAFVTLVGWLRGPPPERKEEGKPSRGGRGRQPPQAAQATFTVEEYNKMVETEDWIGLANVLGDMKRGADSPEIFINIALRQAGMLHNAGEDEQAVAIYREVLVVLGMMPDPHEQYMMLASILASIGQLEEAEAIVSQIIKLGKDENIPLSNIVHAENCLANIWASTNRREEAILIMENIKRAIGRSNAPKAWSRHLMTVESEFVVEEGKIYCKITFQRNARMSTDPPAKKTGIFPAGFTLRCEFENPESGKAPFVRVETVQQDRKIFVVKQEYPMIKKKAYLVEVEVFEDAETTKVSGHHLVLCQSEKEKLN